jgi:hypothetical protein
MKPVVAKLRSYITKKSPEITFLCKHLDSHDSDYKMYFVFDHVVPCGLLEV